MSSDFEPVRALMVSASSIMVNWPGLPRLTGPVKKLSRQITSWPSFNKRSQRCEPKKPTPPVTSVRVRWE